MSRDAERVDLEQETDRSGDGGLGRRECLKLGAAAAATTTALAGVASTAAAAPDRLDDPSASDSVVGGGQPYYHSSAYDAVTRNDADHEVTSVGGLVSALKDSYATVFIPGGTTIDLTGTTNIDIAQGVTLASDRGRNGSRGALLYYGNTIGKVIEPVFESWNGDIRVTGLRFEGPKTRYTHPGSNKSDYVTTGFHFWGTNDRSNTPEIEVDNCHMYGWTHTPLAFGYFKTRSDPARQENTLRTSPHVHHCSLHRNWMEHYGYGVHIYDGTGEFDHCWFDRNRHAISAYGWPECNYEAHHNVVSSTEGHAFDMHRIGQNDRAEGRQGWTAGGWVHIHDNQFRFIENTRPDSRDEMGWPRNDSNAPVDPYRDEAISIRGIPDQGVDIENNEFKHDVPVLSGDGRGEAVEQYTPDGPINGNYYPSDEWHKIDFRGNAWNVRDWDDIGGGGGSKEHTIRLERTSGDGVVLYDFAVGGGSVVEGADTNDYDEVRGGWAVHGSLGGGHDTYHFDGSLESLDVPDSVAVFVDGREIDSDDYRDHTVRLEHGGDELVTYNLGVADGRIEEGWDTNDYDEVRNDRVAHGSMKGGHDSFNFDGELATLDVPDSIDVFVDGEPVDPDDYRDHYLEFHSTNDEYKDYAATASDGIDLGERTWSSEEIHHNTAIGLTNGRNDFHFDGELETLYVEKDGIEVFVDGKEVRTSDHKDHLLTFDNPDDDYRSYTASSTMSMEIGRWGNDGELTETTADGSTNQLDTFYFNGELAAVDVDAGLEVRVDGQAIDPDDYRDHVLDVYAGEGTQEYTVETTGGIDETHVQAGEATIDGTTVTGEIGGWWRTFAFDGEVVSASATGDLGFYVDGEEIDYDAIDGTLLEISRHPDSSGTVHYIVETDGDVADATERGSGSLTDEDEFDDGAIMGAVGTGTDPYWIRGGCVESVATFGGDVETKVDGEVVDLTDGKCPL